MDRKEFMELVFTGDLDCTNSYVNKLSLIKIYNWHLKEIAKAEKKALNKVLKYSEKNLGHDLGHIHTNMYIERLIGQNKGDE